MKYSAVTIRIPKKLKADLKALSKEEKTSVNDLILESLGHFLAARRFRLLRKKALPFAEAQGLLTDKDVFKAIS